MILSLALEAPHEARRLQRQAQLLGGCQRPRSSGLGYGYFTHFARSDRSLPQLDCGPLHRC
eukprot:3329331-Alexandrium_andersonii.AAC.1